LFVGLGTFLSCEISDICKLPRLESTKSENEAFMLTDFKSKTMHLFRKKSAYSDWKIEKSGILGPPENLRQITLLK